MTHAASESEKRGFSNVDPGHILLGVACHPDKATVALFDELELSCDELRETLTERLNDGSWQRRQLVERLPPEYAYQDPLIYERLDAEARRQAEELIAHARVLRTMANADIARGDLRKGLPLLIEWMELEEPLRDRLVD